MNQPPNLSPFVAAPVRLGHEISITAKWIPNETGGLFRTSAETKEMRQEWEGVHNEAIVHPGILSSELDVGVGEEVVLVHHVFQDAAAFAYHFDTTGDAHMKPLQAVAHPGMHLVRGERIPQRVREVLATRRIKAVFGELQSGWVRDQHRKPDDATSIAMTAKWTCKPSEDRRIDALIDKWRQLGTDAWTLEEGLLRFEIHRVLGEDAVIVHRVFETNADLRFHLMKGTAATYREEIDGLAACECCFFRGPVSWPVRTWSRFQHLPATYARRERVHTRGIGSMSDGLVEG